ncbi:Golgi resident protein GCP60-like, partial [Uloborus diversus]|uniref:Golgi resident protein GCP60-like n=1 Tax=Uloborus diversus TaxID=327109 RepID=UPI0024093EB3
MAATVNGVVDSEENCSKNDICDTESVTCNSLNSSISCNGLGDEFSVSWGFNINELFALATTFLKEKEGKAFHISYKDKLSLVAFTQQVLHGKYVEEKAPPLGYLDVIGRDRRQAWQALGDMSEKDAKKGFINLLNSICPLFRPFVLAHKCHLEELERKRKEEEEMKRLEEEEERRMLLEEEKLKLEEEEKQRLEKERQKQSHQ